jgi:hypothetical protein
MTSAAETTGRAEQGAPPAGPLTGAPACPKCGGRMWDNRASKRNPKAPDFKCRDRRCDGVLWPGAHNVARPIVERGQVANHDAAEGQPASLATPLRRSLRDCYLDVTDFVLAEVRPKYDAAGVPCTDATVAAIAATLFIGLCKERGP